MKRMDFLQRPIPWHFPALDRHDGLPIANGTLGALIWGGGSELRITINRADFWDHRGGLDWKPEANYANLRRWLAERDEASLRQAFEGQTAPGTPRRPTRLPMGRLDLTLPSPLRLVAGELDLAAGEARVTAAGDRSGSGTPLTLRASVLHEAHVLVVELPGEAASAAVVGLPAYDGPVREHYEAHGIPAPQTFEADGLAGWVQALPADPALCVAWRLVPAESGAILFVTAAFGSTAEAAIAAARATLAEPIDVASSATGLTSDATVRETRAWWERFWAQAASLSLPDPELELLYYLGLYKLGCISVPGRPAATLQGPWVEENRLPPWSSDYHFNINVQECYWPAYAGNHLETLQPLFTMLDGWKPRLKAYARTFAGVEDGLQLPHAVDDRCTGMGGFWTGAIDHGSTAWVGQLMWQYWLFSRDEAFLRQTAYPFLKGTMRVYEAMLEEETGAGGAGSGEAPLSLPVSVSPEFGGSSFGAWGKNASFQLAVVHFLCRVLVEAADHLGVDEEDRTRWQRVQAGLPRASVEGGEIVLWEGQPLTESHRHHSHLAGIYPFDTLRYHPGEPDADLVRKSLKTWTRRGMGAWTGWCVPWASIIQARCGNGDMAALNLSIFRRAFMRRGYASTHDAVVRGLTAFDGRPEIMQVEAALGAAAAVIEMLIHTADGVTYLFPAVPTWWERAAFAGVRCEGAFLVSAEYDRGQVTGLTVQSEAGCPLRLALPTTTSRAAAAGVLRLRRERPGRAPTVETCAADGGLFTFATVAGERLTLIGGADQAAKTSSAPAV